MMMITKKKESRRNLKKKRIYEDEADYYFDRKKIEGFAGAHRLIKKFPKALAWLRAQPTYTLHKDVRRRYPTRNYKTSGIGDLWQVDLMEMIPYAKVNKGYKYILTVIDVFSRYVWAMPVKSKSASAMSLAFSDLLKRVPFTPLHIQTDQGKEFYNKSVKAIFQKYGINHYSVFSKYKCALVERFNRTLRQRLKRYFTYKSTKIWYDALDDIIRVYNETPHRGINNMRPIDVDKISESKLWQQQQQQKTTTKKSSSPLSLGDFVRISHESGPFRKNFAQNWSEEIFVIVGVDSKDYPIMYYIQDLQGNLIDGKFYKEELQVVSGPQEQYRIEKIIRTKGQGKYKQHYVKWIGYDKSHNSWIFDHDIIREKK